MQNHQNRKLNRLKGYDYSRDGWYFITICAKNREHFFGEIINGEMRLTNIGATAQKCWQEIPAHFPDAKLDAFIIMPNHIHGIIAIENSTAGNKTVGNNNNCSDGNNNCSDYCSDDGNNYYCSLQSWQTKWTRSLSSVIRGLKIGVTKWCRENNCEYFAWQKSFYDHIIRNEKSLLEIRKYIIDNPLKWELDQNNLKNLWM